MKSVFVDSSVLFTATNSPVGGSSKLFTLRQIRLVTSRVVLAETERNVRKKLEPYHLERFFVLVEHLSIIDQIPDNRLIAKTKQIIAEKDAVILGEASLSKTDFLVTLNRKHFFTDKVAHFLKPQKVLIPK